MRKFVIHFFLLCFISLSHAQFKNLSIDDLNNPGLNPRSLQNIQWRGNSGCFTFVANDAMVQCLAREDKRDTLIRLDDLNKEMTKLGLERMKRFPSIRWHDENGFTFITKNMLFYYNTLNKKLEKFNEWYEKAANLDVNYVNFGAAYTRDNNLYITIDNRETALTSEANPGILYGSDRVHRTEWGISKGTFWSPFGKYLAFYRMDETMVGDYPLVNVDARMAVSEPEKYPMAGEKSHEVTVGVYHLPTGKTVYLNTGGPADQFLTNVCWTPDEKSILVAVLNREQDHMKMNMYDVASGDLVRTLFEESNPRYVEPMNPPFFLEKSPARFIWQSQRDGYNHLYLYDLSGKLLKQLTSGPWVVKELRGISTDEREVFFSGTIDSPIESHLYSVNVKTGKILKLTTIPGMHHPYLSPGMDYFVDSYSSLDQPTEYTVADTRGRRMYLLQAGENPLKGYRLGQTTIFTLKAKDSTALFCRMIRPPDFDPSRKYPVIIYVYGGPHSQLVTNSWLGGAGLFLNYLAAKGYIIFTLDNRGTSNRGFEFESTIHRRLGTMEMEDQMRGVEYLRSLPYVDASRIGLNGWSYGGFMTVGMMLRNPGVFKAAAAGGPVIDWKYYEVMYGERYMDTPKENPEGYKDACLLNYVNQLQGNLLIIHGYQDATVVLQNSLVFLKKCVEEGKQADFFLYPGHEHNVRGKDRLHLYRKLELFFNDNL